MSMYKKRNPPWTRDEIILALNVYFTRNIHKVSANEELTIKFVW